MIQTKIRSGCCGALYRSFTREGETLYQCPECDTIKTDQLVLNETPKSEKITRKRRKARAEVD